MEKKNKPINYSELKLEIKAFNKEERTVEGYAAVWNVVDNKNDVLLPTCCDKSIQERGVGSATNRKILVLWQHEQDDPIGHLLELKSDDYGLFFKAYIDKIDKGDRILEQIESGTLNQLSIGFNYVWDKCEWVQNYEYNGKIYAEVFVCKEIVLWEISVVTFGMNEYTHFIKSKEDISKKLNDLNDKFNAAVKVGDTIQIKHIALHYNNLIEALMEKSADKRTTDEPKPQELTIEDAIEIIKSINI